MLVRVSCVRPTYVLYMFHIYAACRLCWRYVRVCKLHWTARTPRQAHVCTPWSFFTGYMTRLYKVLWMNKGVYSRKPPFINFRHRDTWSSWIKVTASSSKIIRDAQEYSKTFSRIALEYVAWLEIPNVLINYSYFLFLFIDATALKLNNVTS